MTTWLTRCFAGLLLVLPFVPAVADDPDDKEIARLVKQLGSSDFRTRDAATKRLTAIGEPALDPLRNVTTPLESRRRAEQILAVIEDRVYGPELCLTGHTATVGGVVWRYRAQVDPFQTVPGTPPAEGTATGVSIPPPRPRSSPRCVWTASAGRSSTTTA